MNATLFKQKGQPLSRPFEALEGSIWLCRRPAMMHRDLKSPNVLLSEEGVAKIADVAMVRTQAGQEHLISAQPIMTPLWAAPEVRIPSPSDLEVQTKH